MTIEELTTDLKKLEAMTDAELTEFFKPYFNVTRPLEKPKPTAKVPTKLKADIATAEIKRLMEACKSSL